MEPLWTRLHYQDIHDLLPLNSFQNVKVKLARKCVGAPPVAQVEGCDWLMGEDTSSMLIISLHASMLKAGIREKSKKIKVLHGQTLQIHIQVPVSVQIQVLRFYQV